MTMGLRKAFPLILVALLTVCMVAGCSGDRWQKAAAASNSVISTVQAAQNVEIGFHDKQLVSDDDHIRIQQVFRSIAVADKDLNAAINSAKDTKGAAAAFQVALDTTDKALQDGSLNLPDKDVQLAITSSLNAARAILLDIRTIAQGK